MGLNISASLPEIDSLNMCFPPYSYFPIFLTDQFHMCFDNLWKLHPLYIFTFQQL